LTNKISGRFDFVIYWEYATVRTEWDALENLNRVDLINLKSRNIGKDHLDQMMLDAFGYSTKVNPSIHAYKLVRKSITNAVHDGTLIQGPVSPEEGFIYQRLLDSSVSETEVMDLRVPMMKGKIPHIYKAYRSSDARFVNVPPRVELELDPNQVLSVQEREQLAKLAELMGLDYAEFDVLRDCEDHKIYVVDANNTPQGPPKNLSPEEKALSMSSYASCFKTQFF